MSPGEGDNEVKPDQWPAAAGKNLVWHLEVQNIWLSVYLLQFERFQPYVAEHGALLPVNWLLSATVSG